MAMGGPGVTHLVEGRVECFDVVVCLGQVLLHLWREIFCTLGEDEWACERCHGQEESEKRELHVVFGYGNEKEVVLERAS